jgi:hypothetical protein
MPNDTPSADDQADSPSLRQRLASATGDRRAEAKALAGRAGDAVGPEEAEIAVREAHGDIEVGTTDPGSEVPPSGELASPSDAENVRDRKST